MTLPWGTVDYKKVLIHLVIYFVGFGLIGVLGLVGKIDFGPYNSVAGLVAGALIDLIRKALDGVKE